MRYLYITFILLSLTIFLPACSDPVGCVDKRAANYDPAAKVANSSCVYPQLELEFVLKMDTLPFEINRIYNIGGENTAFNLFQCYLSEIELVRPNSTIANYDTLYPLVGVNNLTVPLGKVYVETFERLRFNIGVDPISNGRIAFYINDANHPLYAQSPEPMHWNLTDGYIFLKMKGKVDKNGDGIPNSNETFDLQIGTNQLLRSVDFLINKEVRLEQDKIRLEIDVKKLLNNVDLPTESNTQTLNNLPLATKIANNIVAAVRVLP